MAETSGDIEGSAAAAGFGRAVGTHFSLRRIPAPAALLTMAGAAVLGTILALAGPIALALLVTPVTLIVLAVVRQRVRPVAGRRWLMVYEHGLVEAGGGLTQPRLVRYADVTAVVPDPGVPGAPALALAAPPGSPVSFVRLADLSAAADLRATLARHRPDLAWPASSPGRGVLVGAGLVVLALVPAVVPVSQALNPPLSAETAAPARSAAVTAMPGTSVAPTVSASPAAPSSAAPTVRAMPMPTSTADFYDVCSGNVIVPEAPAYAGPPPHRIYANPPSYADPKWWGSTANEIQLVVCTDTSPVPGTKVRTCRYTMQGGEKVEQDLIRTTWTVVIREARTGREVARSAIVGNVGTCSQFPDLDYSGLPPGFSDEQRTVPTSQQTNDTIGKYVLH